MVLAFIAALCWNTRYRRRNTVRSCKRSRCLRPSLKHSPTIINRSRSSRKRTRKSANRRSRSAFRARLAEAYFNVGSYTLAMQECEVILVKEPNAPEILAMLGEIETRLQAAGHAIAQGGVEGWLDLARHKLNGGGGR